MGREFTAHAASGSSRCVHAGGSTSCPRPGIPLVLSTGEADDLTKPPATTPSGGREAGHLGPEGTHGQACFKDRTLLSRKKPGHPEAAGEVEGAGTQVQAQGSCRGQPMEPNLWNAQKETLSCRSLPLGELLREEGADMCRAGFSTSHPSQGPRGCPRRGSHSLTHSYAAQDPKPAAARTAWPECRAVGQMTAGRPRTLPAMC